jgi:ATP-binding cassette subfamily F protein uup
VFDGCLVVVSHDNFFVNRVAEHLFVFEGDGTVSDFQGSYTEYLECRQDLAQLAQARKTSSKQTIVDTPVSTSTIGSSSSSTTSNKSNGIDSKIVGGSSNLSYNEKKEFNKLEKEVAKLNSQIQELEEKISNNSSSSKKEALSAINEWTQQIIKLKSQLEVKELRWMELAEK